ncbi:hypothetical protein V1504DRAFT_435030 [Lipomyces starkeyi]
MAHSIFAAIPENVEDWRASILALTAVQDNTYFPFVNNVYRRKKTGAINENNVRTEYYDCLFFGEASHDKHDRERRRAEALEAHPNLATARRNSGQCSFRLTGRDLYRSDQHKRNAFVREHLSAEAKKLYRPSEIINSASETRSLMGRQALKRIGEYYVRNQEVINLQQKYLREHPDERAPVRGLTAAQDITELWIFCREKANFWMIAKIRNWCRF